MLVREALREALRTLAESGIPAPELGAELLLMHTLGCDRGQIHTHPEREIPDAIAQQYFDLIGQRLTGKPTQYITGHQEFWGLDFAVTPDVLIPRPETERVVETALEFCHGGRLAADLALPGQPRTSGTDDGPVKLVDVGTGSGCIALAMASELPGAEIHAVDISRLALAVAERNAARLKLTGHVRFRESDLLRTLLADGAAGTFDFVVSNPPYVALNDLEDVQREVKEFEPRVAWGGLARADEIYRRLFPEALQLLKPGGRVVVEIGYKMREAVVGLLGAGWHRIEVHPDLSGIPRVVAAQRV
ncbi:MAG: peptide chain release factor N(5)-glutamine methyltransferase [Terriglobia bacterium]